MKRVYDAAIKHKIIEGTNPLSELSAKLEVDTLQRVKNWDTRGASAEAMLLIQKKTGISATWIETGEGPEMVAGWPPGRREVESSGEPVPAAPPTPTVLLSQIAPLLAKVPAGPTRHRVADMMSAWALAPDSATLLANIAGDLHDTGNSGHTESAGSNEARQLRQTAMRLAEANTNPKEKALLVEFLGMLDRITREPPSTPSSSTRLSRTKG